MTHEEQKHEFYAMLDEATPLKSSAKLTNAEVTALIGEIDGISLHTVGKSATVSIELSGNQIELITDFGENIMHTITREGIRELLARKGL